MNKINHSDNRLISNEVQAQSSNATTFIRANQPNRGLLEHFPDEVMTDRWLRVKCDPVWRCGINNFEREGSVLDWRKALPIGNGDIGAAIHGYPDNYTFHIAKNDVWWDNISDLDPYPSMSFIELRERVAMGDSGVKHDIRRTSMSNFTAEPTPTGCARLTLHLCSAGTFYNVKEYLNMMNATASTEFCVSQNGLDGGAFWIQSFAARLEEVLVIRLRPPQNLGMLKFELGRDPLEPTNLALEGMSRDEFEEKFHPTVASDEGFAWFTMPLSGGDSYTVMVTTDSKDIRLAVNDGEVLGRGRPADGPMTLYITLVSSHDTEDSISEARRRLEHALAVGFDIISSEHGSWWNRFWKRSWVALPKEYSENSWYWGLYKAGSARRPGKVCPAYGAPWRKGNYLNWGSFTLGYEETKYNLGLLPTNHAELLEPWIATVRRASENCRPSFERFYGMPGISFPFGFTWMGNPVLYTGLYNSTPMCVYTAGESVKCAWDYFDFTGDMDFLRGVGYPLIRQVALFYHAYLQEDACGRLVIFPSRYNEYDSWCEAMDDFLCNSVLDLTMFRQVFRNANRAATLLGVDAELASGWQDALARLAPLPTWPDGSWKPAEDWHERGFLPFAPHPSLFETWPITVGDEADAWHGSDALRAQALATYEKWLGNHPLDTWDRCFPFLAAARMGDREYMKQILFYLNEIPEAGNLNRADPPDAGPQDGHSPFVVDAGSAFPSEVITECLLQSHSGDIRLFPATPLNGHFAFHSLRARGAFLVSSELRDGYLPYALIQSLRGNVCRIANPFGESARIRNLDTGVIVQIDIVDDILVFATDAEYLYVLESKDCPLEMVPVVTLS